MLGAYPLPERVTVVPTVPLLGVSVSVGVVTVYGAEMMKFVPVFPAKRPRKSSQMIGTVIVVPLAIAPPAVEVNVVVVPLGQAEVSAGAEAHGVDCVGGVAAA